MQQGELAWVAGYLEGEGYFGLGVYNKGRFGQYQYPRVTCTSTDLDVLERLWEYTVMGRIYGPLRGGADNRKPTWQWAVGRSSDAVRLMEQIHSYVGQRRQARIDEVLDAVGGSRSLRHGRTELDRLAWVAGYLEAEGCSYSTMSSKLGYGPYHFPRITANSTDHDVLELLRKYAGVGQIVGPRLRTVGHKPIWTWMVSTKSHAVGLMEALHPYMGQRRQAKITEVLNFCERGIAYPHSRSRLELIDLVQLEQAELHNTPTHSEKGRV